MAGGGGEPVTALHRFAVDADAGLQRKSPLGQPASPASRGRRPGGRSVALSLAGAWIGLAAIGATGAAGAAPETGVERSHAELLYDTYCVGCHTSLAHRRADRRAGSKAEVAEYVRRWSGNQRLGWSEVEVDGVTEMLIRRYYRFGIAPADSDPPP